MKQSLCCCLEMQSLCKGSQRSAGECKDVPLVCVQGRMGEAAYISVRGKGVKRHSKGEKQRLCHQEPSRDTGKTGRSYLLGEEASAMWVLL